MDAQTEVNYYFEEFWLNDTNNSVRAFFESGEEPAINPAAMAIKPDSRGYSLITFEVSTNLGPLSSVSAAFFSELPLVRALTITKTTPASKIAIRPLINEAT